MKTIMNKIASAMIVIVAVAAAIAYATIIVTLVLDFINDVPFEYLKTRFAIFILTHIAIGIVGVLAKGLAMLFCFKKEGRQKQKKIYY